MNAMKSPLDIARDLYAKQAGLHAQGREALGRPLTLCEKILFAHRDDARAAVPERGRDIGRLRPDRVAMQDATAQMAILQFISAGLPTTALPTTVHCDHLILARKGAETDLGEAEERNGEVYRFLASAAAKYGMGFWKPGSGIIHQVVLENYAFPGGLIIGTDSHTPNAGGLGMFAAGVGGADAVDAMVDIPWEVLWPRVVGVHLSGSLGPWAAPKDVILELLDRLTCAGGTGRVIEYCGPGTETLSATGKATITNMGAELGATTSIFPYDDSMQRYLRATGRSEVAELASAHSAELVADPEATADPARFYDEVVEIDLSQLEPSLVGPHTPDLRTSLADMAAAGAEARWPLELSAALIGSCTNSSYEDLGKAADVARRAMEKGLAPRVPFFVSPGSEQVQGTTERDGQLEMLRTFGATILANACGPCIGQWKRDDCEDGTPNSIVTSFNRNFRGRNDGNRETLGFIGSPEVVTALALAGRIDFDPRRDELAAPDGSSVRLDPPSADELPRAGFATDITGYVEPPIDPAGVTVDAKPGSDRIALLTPFDAPRAETDFDDLRVLVKTSGKTTTDHISPAGPWLRYRGHLDKISDNLFLGVNNAFTDAPGTSRNAFTGVVASCSAVARDYKARGQGWIAVGDANYGEGSSREHAAMEPRHLGCRAVVVRSFARIHETNLKKQGVLPLLFDDPADYDRVRDGDRASLLDVGEIAPGRAVELRVTHEDGSEDILRLTHSLTAEQIEWFRAGSALNAIRARRRATSGSA